MFIKRPLRFFVFMILIIALPIIGSYVYFTYISPLPETIVPDVIGLNENVAVSRIERLGLTPNIESRGTTSTLVTNQRPEPGKIVKAGRVVSIIIGGSNSEIPMPSAIVVTPQITPEASASSEVNFEIVTSEGESND